MSYLQDSGFRGGRCEAQPPRTKGTAQGHILFLERRGLGLVSSDCRFQAHSLRPHWKANRNPNHLRRAPRGNGFSCSGLETFLTLGMQGVGGAGRPREQAREVILLSEKTPVFGFFFYTSNPTANWFAEDVGRALGPASGRLILYTILPG